MSAILCPDVRLPLDSIEEAELLSTPYSWDERMELLVDLIIGLWPDYERPTADGSIEYLHTSRN